MPLPWLSNPDQAGACVIDRHGQGERASSDCLRSKRVDTDRLIALSAVINQDRVKSSRQRHSCVCNAGAGVTNAVVPLVLGAVPNVTVTPPPV